MTKDDAQTELRQKIMALDINDLALLVKVASEGINDLPASIEIADVVSMQPDQLQEWAERVLLAGDANDCLMVLAEKAMGWYEGVPGG